MIKRNYSIIFGLIILFFFVLSSSSSVAEFDQTRKMKAKAQCYFEEGEYYKAIDIWAEVLKMDSYDKEALGGISKAQEIIEKAQREEEKTQGRKLRGLIQKGKNYYRDREYKKALSCWGQALFIDPSNKEVLDLIEETHIKARYQISILDKLDREKRIKTPYIEDLDKIANKMIELLEKTDVKIKEEKIKKEVKEEAAVEAEEKVEVEEKKEFIRAAFAKGEEFYKKERFKEAISEWNKILPYLPKSDEIAVKITELKERIAAEEKTRECRISEDKKSIITGKAERKREKEKIEVRIKEEKSPGRRNFLIIVIIVLLALFLPIKLSARIKIKPRLVKMFPKMTKAIKEFEPRDLRKLLKKKKEKGHKNKDKDLFG